MNDSRESYLSKVAALATILGTMGTLFAAWIAWQSYSHPTVVDPPPTPSPIEVTVAPPNPNPTETPSPEPPISQPPPTHPIGRPRPVEVTLENGEQTTVMDDQVSLAAGFQSIGEEKTATLHLNGEPHAILGAGAQFQVNASGRRYSVYVLKADFETRTMRLKVSAAP